MKAYAEVPLTESALAERFARAAPFLSGAGGASFRTELQRLGGELFEGLLSDHVRARVKGTQLQHLRLHVDEAIAAHPWELLFDGEDHLGLRFALGRVLSAKLSAPPQSAKPTPARALVIADPTGDLPGAAREGDAVAGLLREGFGGELHVLRGVTTRAQAKAALRGATLVHFAGHAHQSSPGLTFSDGALSADELLDACGAAPRFFFANACHASAGSDVEGRAVSALATVLLAGGAKHFLGPAYAIADGDALTFSLRFYEALLSGQSFGGSAQRARQVLFREGQQSTSFACYALYGEPRASLPPQEARKIAPRLRQSSERNPVVTPPEPTEKDANRGLLVPALLSIVTFGVIGFAVFGGKLRDAEPSPPVPVVTPALHPPPAPPVSAPTGPVRLCVFPFKVLGGDPTLAPVGEGLSEAVVTDFGQRVDTTLIERGQVDVEIEELEFGQSKYVDPETRAELGKLKGAEVAVMGAVQRSGDTLRASARFVKVETGEVLHTLRVDRPAKDPFELQDELATQVKGAMDSVVKKVRP